MEKMVSSNRLMDNGLLMGAIVLLVECAHTVHQFAAAD